MGTGKVYCKNTGGLKSRDTVPYATLRPPAQAI